MATLKESYLAPPRDSDASYKMSWISNFLHSAESELRAEPGYQDYASSIETLLNIRPQVEGNNGKLSLYKNSRTSRQVLEILATLCDLNPSWEYTTSDFEQCGPTATLLTKYWKSWYSNPTNDFHETIFQMLQWAALGEGWLSPIWQPSLTAISSPGLKINTYGPEDVLIFDHSRDKDIQKSYAVAIRNEIPLHIALELYPEHEYLLCSNAQNSSPSWLKRISQTVRGAFDSPLLNAVHSSTHAATGKGHIAEVFHIYIRDTSINTTGSVVQMGTPGTSWAYNVPSLNQPIPTGVNDPNGSPVTRPATVEDCRLYPSRRLIICTRNGIISDGPSPWWHQQVPLVRFSLKDWIFERLGGNLIKDGKPISDTEESLIRGAHDSMETRLRPPLAVDKSKFSDSFIKAIDVRLPGQKYPVNSTQMDAIKPILNPATWELPQQFLPLISLLQQNHDHTMGVPDVRALAEARQVPSDETMEKFMQLAGPIVKHYSRIMERGLLKMGNMISPLIFQFSTAKERMSIFGKDGLVQEDFDFDPNNLVPAGVSFNSENDRYSRMRKYVKKFSFSILPNSAYEISDMQRQMLFFQLWRDPKMFPLDPWTFASVMKVDIGPPPPGATTMIDRWTFWMENLTKFQAVISAQAQVKQQEILMSSQLAPLMQMMQQGASEGGGESESGSGRSPGRPPSGQEPPKLETRDGGSRTTISES